MASAEKMFDSILKIQLPRGMLHASRNLPPRKAQKLTTTYILKCIRRNMELSPITRRNYITQLKLLETQTEVSLLYCILHPKKTLKHVSKTYLALATRKSFCASLLGAIKHCPLLKKKVANTEAMFFFKGALRECNLAIQSRYDQHQPSERQKDSFILYEDLQAAKAKLPQGCFSRLILSMFLDQCPVRSGDYHRVKLILGKEKFPKAASVAEPNFIFVPADESQLCRMVLRNFKTAHQNGPLVTMLPQAVSQELRANLKVTGDRDWLFLNSQNQVWPNAAYFGKWASRVLKVLFPDVKNPGLGLMRHAYLNHFKVGNLNDSHRQQIARAMCNSIAVQNCYLWKDSALDEIAQKRRTVSDPPEITINLVE